MSGEIVSFVNDLLAPTPEPEDVEWNPLHNKVVTEHHAPRKFEQPWHRIALYELAKGIPPKKVAELCDVTPKSIYDLCRTSWFQKNLDEEIRRASGVGQVEQFRAEVAMALAVESELLANPRTPAAVRAKIAATKIERVHGKALQKVEFNDVTTSANPVAEVEALQRQLSTDLANTGIVLPQHPSGRS